MTVTASRLFLVISVVLFLIATLLTAGVISSSDLGWALPGGLTALALAFLVP